MSKVLRLLLFVFIVLLFTMSLAYAAPAKIAYTTYEDPVNMFKVSYPSDWQLSKNQAPFKDFTMVATFTTSPPPYAQNGLIVGIGVVKPESLPMPPDVFAKSKAKLDPTEKERLSEIIANNIAKNDPNFTHHTLSKTKFEKYHTMDILTTTNLNSKDVTLRYLILYSKDCRFYIVVFGCESSKYDTFKPTMDKLVNSLQFFNDDVPYTSTYTYSDGSRYEGSYLNGKEHGKGLMVWSNADCYEGDFIDGKRTGKGVFTRSNGARYEGGFTDGHLHGKGIVTWSNGDRYEGDFIDGKRNGKGVYTRSNGDRYEGDFLDDQALGYGVYIRADGTRFKVKFVDGNFVVIE